MLQEHEVFTVSLQKSENKLEDGVLLEESVREICKKFFSEGRKVTLVNNNCPTNPQIENLESIKLFSLPPDITSQT